MCKKPKKVKPLQETKQGTNDLENTEAGKKNAQQRDSVYAFMAGRNNTLGAGVSNLGFSGF